MTPVEPGLVERATEWASELLGTRITGHALLPGGMTSTMLVLLDDRDHEWVLRLMTNEPWRSHGTELVRREHAAFEVLAGSGVMVPSSLAVATAVDGPGAAAHLMTRLPGTPTADLRDRSLLAMAELLTAIHDVRPATPFRAYQSWAWPAKWVVPDWSRHPESWERAFTLLAEDPPEYEPTFLHRDFSHRNLLWSDGAISGVVDWVETSTGPVWLDAGHAATNLAVLHDPALARAFLQAYARTSGRSPEPYWLVMDTVGFLPPPGRRPMFAAPAQLARLDGWLHELMVRL